MSSSLRREVTVILAFNMRGVCYYEIFAEGETMHVALYLESLKRFIDRWFGNRKHSVWLLDDNAIPYRHASITSRVDINSEMISIKRWFQPAYFYDLGPNADVRSPEAGRALGQMYKRAYF